MTGYIIDNLKGVMNMAANPFQQLSVIRNASQKGKRITDCYRLMYKKKLWEFAYDHLCIRGGISHQSLPIEAIDEIINELQMGNYRFLSYKGNLFPCISSRDLLVLEGISTILDSVYCSSYPTDSDDSSRKVQIIHKGLSHIKKKGEELTWCLFCELKVDSIFNQMLLINLVKKKINDHRFLLLFHHAFTSGSISKVRYVKGSRLGLILENIFYDELDSCVKEKMRKEKKGNASIISSKNDVGLDSRISFEYIRYSNQFVIGLSCSKKTASLIFNQIQQSFLSKFEMTIEKDYSLNLTHFSESVLFLGYHIRKCARTKSMLLEIPLKKLQTLSFENNYGEYNRFIPMHRSKLVNKSEVEILSIYNAELKKVAIYYKLANNWQELDKLFSLAKGSFIKTIALKRKSSSSKVSRRMSSYKQGELCVKVREENGNERLYPFVKLKQFSYFRS